MGFIAMPLQILGTSHMGEYFIREKQTITLIASVWVLVLVLLLVFDISK
jgi:hypothetical protein